MSSIRAKAKVKRRGRWIQDKSKAPPLPIKDLSHFKPRKFRHYLTLAELCVWLEGYGVGRHKTRIIKLEQEGKIPEAKRVQRGQISIRLWSPDQAKEIRHLLRTEIRPGRPPNE